VLQNMMYFAFARVVVTKIYPTCLICGAAEENVLHFILQCEKLQSERVALLSDKNAIWQNEFQKTVVFHIGE
jgi:hypothetical protein